MRIEEGHVGASQRLPVHSTCPPVTLTRWAGLLAVPMACCANVPCKHAVPMCRSVLCPVPTCPQPSALRFSRRTRAASPLPCLTIMLCRANVPCCAVPCCLQPIASPCSRHTRGARPPCLTIMLCCANVCDAVLCHAVLLTAECFAVLKAYEGGKATAEERELSRILLDVSGRGRKGDGEYGARAKFVCFPCILSRCEGVGA